MFAAAVSSESEARSDQKLGVGIDGRSIRSWPAYAGGGIGAPYRTYSEGHA